MKDKDKALIARQLEKQLPGLDALFTDPNVKQVRGRSGKVYAGVLGCCLPPAREPRRSAILLVESPWFDPLILLTILTNCVTMAIESPLDPEGTAKAAVLGVFEWVFLIIFTAELLSKLVAYSFIWHKEAYLRDPWCQLDFVVVTLAWLPILFPNMGNYSVLRAFRALRPLRALKRVPGMPLLVQWILSVLPKMGNVLMLCAFVFLVFGIVGMELFKGALHYRCASPGYEEPLGHPVRRMLRGQHTDVADSGSARFYDTEISCNPSRETCPEGATCAYFDENPNHGITSFDSVSLIFISYIQAITFDDWATAMYALMDAFSPMVWIYFILIIMVAGLFVINLFLAVVFLEYGNTQEEMKREEAMKTQRTARSSTARSRSPSPLTERSKGGASPAAPGEGGSPEGAAPDTEAVTLLKKDAVLSDGNEPSLGKFNSLSDCSPDGIWRRAFKAASGASWLNNTSTALVLINMVLMCMSFEGMSEEYEAGLEFAASIISWLFIIEMGIKLIGLGCAGYWSDGWNILDGTIVSMSIVEMLMTVLMSSGGVNVSSLRILRMLRMLRVLRILRLMRSWKGLYKIIMTFIRAIPQMSNLVILILLTMFMFSLLGMQLFGGLYNPSTGYAAEPCPGGICSSGLEDKPHYHFDYCGPAMITVFILLTGEWVDAMEPATALMGPGVCLFFIFVVVLGKYLLMNLLVAVILTEFAEEDEAGGADTARSTARDTSRMVETSTDEGRAKHREELQAQYGETNEPWPKDYSLCCFGPQSAFRRLCRAAIRKPQFDQVIIAAIIISSVCLALDSPRLDPASTMASVLKKLDLFFTLLFFCEMMSKIVAFGFLFSKDAYIKSVWNQVDFVIVCISLVVLLAESVPQLRPLRVLRVLRVLRPLRLISRNAGMKLIISSLFKALPAVTNVFGVIFALQLVFSILGMQLFSGSFGSCNNPAILTRVECDDDYVPPAMALPDPDELPMAAVRRLKGGGGGTWEPGTPLRWTNPATGSFDNFGESMRVLYIMSSGDQWEIPMWLMMGAQGSGKAAVRNDFSGASVYGISWMFVSYIFAINLFVGVVVDNFSRMQKKESGSATMTKEQQQWATTMQALSKALPTKVTRAPQNCLRRALYHLINSSAFDGFITFVIIANIGIMACDYWGIEQDEDIFQMYNTAMTTFGYIYYVEAIFKMTALGFSDYFSDNWCRFDFFLVCTSLLDQFAAELLNQIMPLPPMLLRVLRVLRILRILRLLKGAKDLRDLIVTMVLSFPSLLNVGSLLALIIFMYAVLGLNMFTFLSHESANGGITEFRNFETFGGSFLVLFQCLTGDGWSSIMADAMKDETTGLCSAADGDCGSPAAIPYFISFQVVGSFVFLNLVVAVILENFAALQNVSTELVSASDLEAFGEAWAEFDPDATNFISMDDVPHLLLKVAKPLGVRGKPLRQAKTLCLMLDVTQHDGKVAFSELLKALIDSNYSKSGADLDEFKEVVPGVFIPPIMAKRDGPSMGELLGVEVFAQEHVRNALFGMLQRARRRLQGESTTLGSRVVDPPPGKEKSPYVKSPSKKKPRSPPKPKADPSRPCRAHALMNCALCAAVEKKREMERSSSPEAVVTRNQSRLPNAMMLPAPKPTFVNPVYWKNGQLCSSCGSGAATQSGASNEKSVSIALPDTLGSLALAGPASEGSGTPQSRSRKKFRAMSPDALARSRSAGLPTSPIVTATTALERRLAAPQDACETTFSIVPRGPPPKSDLQRWPDNALQSQYTYPPEWVAAEPFSSTNLNHRTRSPPKMPPLRSCAAIKAKQQQKSELWNVPTQRSSPQVFERSLYDNPWSC